MADAAQTNGDVGAPQDAIVALVRGAVDAAKHPGGQPIPDARVSAAFALGWQMAELYRPGPANPIPKAVDEDLPGLSRLDENDRAQISVLQIKAAMAKLADPVTAATLTMPDLTPLISAFESKPNEAPAAEVRDLHIKLLATLTAADFRLGKAYGLGRALADTCRVPTDPASLRNEFQPGRIAQLRSRLDDLASTFPAHAAKSVSTSLGQWCTTLSEARNEDGGPAEVIGRQGQLWRSLLSGEKSGLDMLATTDYVQAAGRLFQAAGRVARSFARHFPFLLLGILVLFGGGVALVWASSSSGSIAAGAAGIIASLGLTWKTIGSAVGTLAGDIEQHLWGAEVDAAVATAITLWPTNPPAHRHARGARNHHADLAMTVANAATPQAAPSAVSHGVALLDLATMGTTRPGGSVADARGDQTR